MLDVVAGRAGARAAVAQLEGMVLFAKVADDPAVLGAGTAAAGPAVEAGPA
ncbi:hypothetical protein F4556_003517 [Kitasatospora gansuensis]|uniref:Uncharacterized protein n=1 Tax=Kitasatospora gansuensis TaxID=258050 RepID=A0A7W7WHP7_9ACTN|nr:hypothetical protein [Kitasatospora gansuensis]MBB4947982.1 hypothetical protein [Kitasatospora gansuensis]